jgi:hypothetical protein
MARLITQHQMGMVLERASGIRFPRRVESTTIALHMIKQTTTRWMDAVEPYCVLPLMSSNRIQPMEITPAYVEIPFSSMTIGWFKVNGMDFVLSRKENKNRSFEKDMVLLLIFTLVGLIYHDPHRSFAFIEREKKLWWASCNVAADKLTCQW